MDVRFPDRRSSVIRGTRQWPAEQRDLTAQVFSMVYAYEFRNLELLKQQNLTCYRQYQTTQLSWNQGKFLAS